MPINVNLYSLRNATFRRADTFSGDALHLNDNDGNWVTLHLPYAACASICAAINEALGRADRDATSHADAAIGGDLA